MLAVVPPMAALLIRVLGATLRYRDVNAEGTPNGHTMPGPTVFAFWHCTMLTSAHRFRNLGIAILISRSFDGELIARTVERLGFLAVFEELGPVHDSEAVFYGDVWVAGACSAGVGAGAEGDG